MESKNTKIKKPTCTGGTTEEEERAADQYAADVLKA